jgi:hypothetical protein
MLRFMEFPPNFDGIGDIAAMDLLVTLWPYTNAKIIAHRLAEIPAPPST